MWSGNLIASAQKPSGKSSRASHTPITISSAAKLSIQMKFIIHTATFWCDATPSPDDTFPRVFGHLTAIVALTAFGRLQPMTTFCHNERSLAPRASKRFPWINLRWIAGTHTHNGRKANKRKEMEIAGQKALNDPHLPQTKASNYMGLARWKF